MRYRLIAVGKVKEPYIAAAVSDFRERLRRYVPLEELEVAASKTGRPEEAIAEEGGRIERALVPGEQLWVLDRNGTMFSSEQLAQTLQTAQVDGISRITFVVGGTFGSAPGVLARAGVRWSLGPLTFLHEWARAIVLEQLYRAAKIARNEPYHH